MNKEIVKTGAEIYKQLNGIIQNLDTTISGDIELKKYSEQKWKLIE